jgi:multiple sugar transport system permease protein
MRERQAVIKTLSYIFLIVSSLIMVYPMIYMLLGTFTTPDQFLRTVTFPIPNTLNINLFRRALNAGISASYLFTLIRVGWYLAVTLLVGLVGGYIFSKLNFPGKNRVFLFFLSGMVMPGVLMLVPTYLMMAWWPNTGGNNWLGQGGHGLIEDWRVLFIGGLVPVFAIFILKQSFDMLPNEYQDAAKIDGAGIFTIMFRVYGPLLKPPLVALTILVFLGIWNDYLWPSLTITGHPQYYPIGLRMSQVMITESSSQYGVVDYPAVFVKTFLGTWPPAAVYFLLQRYFVQGLVGSGLKG